MELTRRTALKAGSLAAAALSARPSLAAAPAAPGGALQGEWLRGDTHVHTDHSSDGSGPRQASDQMLPGNVAASDQIQQAERMGLDWLPLTDHRTYDQHWSPDWTSSRLVLVPGEEANGSPHATVHGHVEQRVDGPNPEGSAAYRHLQQSVWDVHAQDAVWTTAHPDDGEVERVEADGSVVPNANADTVAVDQVELLNSGDSTVKTAYVEDRWNAGWRTGVVAASDSHFKELWPASGPGQPTTWVFARDRSERALLDALRAGRTAIGVAGLGPRVTVTVDLDGDGAPDATGGDEVHVPAGPLVLRVRAERAAGLLVQVWAAPGRSAGPVATFTPSGQDTVRDVPVAVPQGLGWFRADVVDPATGRLLAMVSPLFTTTGGPAEPRAALPLPAPLGLTDRAVPVVSRAGFFAGFPDVAAVPGGAVTVAEVHEDGATRVVAVDARGTRTDLAPASRSARFPRVAASGRDVWAVWQDERAGQAPRRPAVYCRRSADAGTTWGPEVRLSSGAGRAEHPDVAAWSGGAVVVWSDNSSTGAFDVLARDADGRTASQNLSAPGKRVDPGNPVDSRSRVYPASLFPAVAARRDGTVAVAWGDNRFDPDPGFTGGTSIDPGRLLEDTPLEDVPLDCCPGQPLGCRPAGTAPDAWEVLVAVRPAGVDRFGPAVRTSPQAPRADRHPDVVFDRDGALVVAWDSKPLRASGVAVSVLASRSGDLGATWASPVAVAPDPVALSERPRLAVTRAGVAVVWQDTRSADWRWSVQRSLLGPDGWGPAERLTGDGNATWPACDADHLVVVSDRGARVQRDVTQAVLRLERATAVDG